jgi:hypothetical protein
MGEAKRKEQLKVSKFTHEKRPPYVHDEDDKEPGDLFWMRTAFMIAVFYLITLGVVWYLH